MPDDFPSVADLWSRLRNARRSGGPGGAQFLRARLHGTGSHRRDVVRGSRLYPVDGAAKIQGPDAPGAGDGLAGVAPVRDGDPGGVCDRDVLAVSPLLVCNVS